MKFQTATVILSISMMAGCASNGGGTGATVPATQKAAALSAASATSDRDDARYRVTALGTLGGTVSAANAMSTEGLVSGLANLPGDQTEHAVLWRGSTAVNLGTLGGPNSAVNFPNHSSRGEIVGISQTSEPSRLHENWSCSNFFPQKTATGYVCLGFVYQNGKMTPLPTLGGENGFAASGNDWGQVAGWAENDTHDRTCVSPQVLQFKPVIWEPGGRIKELPTFHDDPDGAATAINDRGHVAGISGICDNAVGRFSAAHAVLWRRNSVTLLRSLGGVAWNTPFAINSRDEIVGFSDLRGDANGNPNFHAVLWTADGRARDLKTLPGDAISEALGINDRGQIVGVSYGAGFTHPRAFLFEHDVMTDLNSLIAPGSSLTLTAADDINDSGEIAGTATDKKTGASPAFLAIPKRADRN